MGEQRGNRKGISGECGRRERAVAWLAEEDDGEARQMMNEQCLSVFSPLKEKGVGEGATLQKIYHLLH